MGRESIVGEIEKKEKIDKKERKRTNQRVRRRIEQNGGGKGKRRKGRETKN